MNEKEFLEKYQVSSGEYSDIKGKYERFKSKLNIYGDFLSMSKIRELEQEHKTYQEYLNKKSANQYAHEQKGVLGRTFSSPEYVSEPSHRSLDTAIDTMEELKDLEEDFNYVCNAHRLKPLNVFQDILGMETGYTADQIADKYRAYQHAKGKTAFRKGYY